MLFIFGTRYTRLARFIDHEHICYPCKAYDKEINVYRSYFHICLIPFFPIGARHFEIRCRNCGDETKTENLVNLYEAKARTPFYFYSAWILLASIVIFWFYWNKNGQQNKMRLVSNPAIGDVYTIKQHKNGETSYYFIKIIQIDGDSIFAYHNSLDYGDFVNRPAADDYYVKDDTLIYKRKELKEMLENDEIFSATRDAGEGTAR